LLTVSVFTLKMQQGAASKAAGKSIVFQPDTAHLNARFAHLVNASERRNVVAFLVVPGQPSTL